MHSGHRDRLKARFLKSNLDDFEPHNALELALFYAIPVQDTNELAHRLIAHFGSFSAALDADFVDLCRVKGVGKHVATFLKLIPALGRYYENDVNKDTVTFSNDEQVAAFIRPQFIGRTKEQLFMLTLDNKGSVVYGGIIFEGSINSVSIHVREILEIVMRTKAASVVIAHNHPRGIAVPSNQDLVATHTIKQALAAINVKLLDHLVFAGADYVSMKASNFID